MTSILVVEDSPTQAYVLKGILEERGYVVRVAGNGVEAFDLLVRQPPDLVISDILMPEMDGFELCRRIRNEPRFANLPIILLTSLDNPRDVLNSLKVGADNFISKPFNEAFLHSRIEQILENARLSASDPGSMEIFFDGEYHRIDMDRSRVMHLLFSTYEMALHKNQELVKAQRQLRTLNAELEVRVAERTASLLAEIVERKKTQAELANAHHELEIRVQDRTAELSAANQKLEEEIVERRKIERELVEAKRAADKANKAKSGFLANMSHEIRTPLNGIIAMTRLLQETSLSSSQRDFASTIGTCADTLLELVNDILDYSKIEAGKIDLVESAFNVRTLVEEVADVVAIKAYEKGLELTIVIDKDVPLDLEGDAGKLRQVLLNLISNAVKFTIHGEIVVRVEVEKRIRSSVTLKFSVKDTGIGIRREDIDCLFQSFSQVDNSSTRKFGGTGLGLAICKRLVEIAEGEIGVETVEGQGSTFSFTMPFGVASATEAPMLRIDADVIVAETHDLTRSVIVGHLTSVGCRCSEVTSAEGLMERLRSHPGAASIVLLGDKINTTDPMAFIKSVHDLPGCRNLSVFLLHPVASRFNDRLSDEAGIAGTIVKPVKFRPLVDSIREKACQDKAEAAPAPAPVQEKRLRILVAEDNLINQKVARYILVRSGYEAAMVANGQEALEALASGHYDAILMDVQMPVMDGVAATIEIRRREQNSGRRIPIIAMTAHALKEDMDRCFEAGMDDYICKPVTPATVVETIAKHVGAGAWTAARKV